MGKPQINQTVMPGLQFPMFQAPLTANVQIQQQQPVLVAPVAASQPQMVQQQQPVMAQQQMIQQPVAVTNMKPMVHQQAPVVVEETQKTSPNPFGNAFDFLFSKTKTKIIQKVKKSQH